MINLKDKTKYYFNEKYKINYYYYFCNINNLQTLLDNIIYYIDNILCFKYEEILIMINED